MKRSPWFAAAGALAVVLSGCQNSLDDPLVEVDNPQVVVQTAAQTVESTLQLFNAGNYFAFGIVPSRGIGCVPADDVCVVGSAEFCFDASTSESRERTSASSLFVLHARALLILSVRRRVRLRDAPRVSRLPA